MLLVSGSKTNAELKDLIAGLLKAIYVSSRQTEVSTSVIIATGSTSTSSSTNAERSISLICKGAPTVPLGFGCSPPCSNTSCFL
jgi:hypothetical protein